MYQKRASQSYQSVQVTTIDRGKLLLMMYDGAVKFLTHARDGLEAKDIQKFARFLSKSQAIIAELMNTLDFEKGGEIAKDLDRLYDFMLFYLTEANIQKDATKINRVIELIEIIAGAYREIIDGKKVDLEDAVAKTQRAIAATQASGAPAEAGLKQLRVSL
jgi:flagellar secretion chaperone FliS